MPFTQFVPHPDALADHEKALRKIAEAKDAAKQREAEERAKDSKTDVSDDQLLKKNG